MSSFCKQCCIEFFGADTHNLACLVEDGEFIEIICECCGHTIVDYHGKCVWAGCKKHKGFRLKNE